MSLQMICDGCKTPLFTLGETRINSSKVKELVIEGKRANGLTGGGVPDGSFHWCLQCAKVAFAAVEDARIRNSGWVR